MPTESVLVASKPAQRGNTPSCGYQKTPQEANEDYPRVLAQKLWFYAFDS